MNDEGEIQYLEYQLYENNGWVFGDPIVSLALLSVRNAYDDARWNCELYNVMSDNISYSWCRAPGNCIYYNYKLYSILIHFLIRYR